MRPDGRDANCKGVNVERDPVDVGARQQPARMAERRAHAIVRLVLPGGALRRRRPFCGLAACDPRVEARGGMQRPCEPCEERLQQHRIQAKDQKSRPPSRQEFAPRLRHEADYSRPAGGVKLTARRMADLRPQAMPRFGSQDRVAWAKDVAAPATECARTREAAPPSGQRARNGACGVEMEFLLPADMSLALFIGLACASFFTAFIGLFTGTAGGLILLALMAVVMPAASVVPVHTLVQLGSGFTRTILMWRWVMRGTILPFLAGAVVGAALGAKTFVALPPSMLMGILGVFILIVTWLPKLGRLGAERGRFAVVGFAATFLGVFVSATGTLVAPFVASASPDRRNHAATLGALMMSVHILKLGAFAALGFSVWDYVPLIVAMVSTGAVGNWLGEVALARTSEQRFRIILQIGLTILALRLIWNALAGG